MAILSPTQIRTYIQSPQNTHAIQKAKEHESEINSYCLPHQKGGITKALDKAKSVLVKERGEKVEELWENYTPAIIDEIKRHFEKIYEAEGGFEKFRFGDEDEKIDVINYLQGCFEATPGKLNGLSINHFFRTIAKNTLFEKPNTIIVVDHPPLKENEDGTYVNLITKEVVTYNTPYIITIPITEIHDIEVSTRGIEYLIVKRKEDQIVGKKNTFDVFYVYDDQKYLIYKKVKEGKIKKISEVKHGFGKCPARYILQKDLSPDKIQKKSLISPVIPYLESYQIFRSFAEIYKHESGFSERIVPGSESCNGKQASGMECSNGYIKETKLFGSEASPVLIPCQKCQRRKKEKHSFGKQYDLDIVKIVEGLKEHSGTFVKIFQDSFKRLEADTEVMRFHADNLEIEEQRIKGFIKGQGFNQTKSKEAFNEKHVDANLEDQRIVLSEAAEQLEGAWQWCVTMIAESRYTTFQSYQKYFGRDYVLDNASAYLSSFKQIKDMGMDDYVLNQEALKILQKRYSDRQVLEIWKVLMAVIPFRHQSTEQVLKNAATLLTNKTTTLSFYLRMYSANWLEEFDISNDFRFWGSAISATRRVEIIRKWFYDKAAKAAEGNTKSLFGVDYSIIKESDINS